MNQYGVALAIVVIIWLGLTESISAAAILVGLVVAYLALRSFGSYSVYRPQAPPIRRVGRRLLTALIFIPLFLWEVFTSAIAVARLAFSIHIHMNPGIVRVRTNLRGRTAVTALANLITLTPGTLTMDFNSRRRYYYVHWIDIDMAGEDGRLEAFVKRMEHYLRRIFE